MRFRFGRAAGELQRLEGAEANPDGDSHLVRGEARGEGTVWHPRIGAVVGVKALGVVAEQAVEAAMVTQQGLGRGGAEKEDALGRRERAERTEGQPEGRGSASEAGELGEERLRIRAGEHSQADVWLVVQGVEGGRKPGADAPLGRTLQPEEYASVTWTLDAPEDEAVSDKAERRRHRLRRLLQEAAAQAGAPTDDLAHALVVSRRTILRDMEVLAQAQQIRATRNRKDTNAS